jgi:hypothetical protein
MKISSKIKTAIVAASVLSLTAIAGSASAGVVTFKNTNGTWSNAVGGSNVQINNSADTVTWGANGFWSDKSSFDFDPLNLPGISLASGATSSAFSLAKFVHDNQQISGNAITAVDLLFNTDIYVDNQFVANRSFKWTFNHEETANDGSCPYGGTSWTSYCHDKVTVAYSGNFGGDSFQVGNDVYTLNLAGWQVDGVAKQTFITKENDDSTAFIRGTLSMTSAVPEPATWAMMLVGFFGAGSMLRSTRRKELMATVA